MEKGDFMFWNICGCGGEWISIFDHVDENGNIQAIFSIALPEKKFYTKPEVFQKHGFFALCNISRIRECRPATAEEQDTLLGVLDKAGFGYDRTTMKLIPKIEFHHGDVVQAIDVFGQEWLIIFDKKDDSTGAIYSIVSWNIDNGSVWFSNKNQDNIFCQNSKGILSCRPGTPKERDMLNAELKKRNLRWDAEKGLLTSILEPFEKVLVRDTEEGVWVGDLFTRYQPKSFFPFRTLGDRRYRYCIPYRGNEHLLGTTNSAN